MKYLVKWILIGILVGLLVYVLTTYVGEGSFSANGFIIHGVIGIAVGYVAYRDKKKFRDYNKRP